MGSFSLMHWIIFGAIAFAVWRFIKSNTKTSNDQNTITITVDPTAQKDQKDGLRWSKNDHGPLPLKALTRQQYECLSDAASKRKILGCHPSEMYDDRPKHISAHASKTVLSLEKHGFLEPSGNGMYQITDKGLQATETLPVRY